MITDTIGDLVTRLRNAQMAKQCSTVAPYSVFREGILKTLATEGYIAGYTIFENERGHKNFKIDLKYYNGKPVIAEIKRISKPGRRVYSAIKKLPCVKNGLGIHILSTSVGIMSDVEARKKSLGGEVLCSVF